MCCADVCCVDLNMQLTFALETQSEQSLTLHRPLGSGALCSVQSGLQLWPFYLYLPGSGTKIVRNYALSFGLCLLACLLALSFVGSG